jgi:Domain of unknown function (DUF5666)
MNAMMRSIRVLAGVLLLAAVTFSFSTCGGIGGSDFAGGGTGGTGISTGSVTGFGSVVMNGVHFRTDSDVAPKFKTKKLVNGSDRSGQPDREVFAEGMVVTVRHGSGDNNASMIEYRDNLLGPIAGKVSGMNNIIEVLGQTIVVDNASTFASIHQKDVVEVSGFADNAGRILATLVLPLSPSVNEFEVKGFVSGASSTGFRLGPLPDGSGVTVSVYYGAAVVSGLPGGPADGMFVQVTTAKEPAGGVITATRIVRLAARTEFPDNALVDLEGLVTTPWSGQGNDLSFAVEGKRVRWEAGTEFGGGTRDKLRQTNLKVQVHGTENGGVLSAARIAFR